MALNSNEMVEQAKKIWQQFNQKYHSITGDPRYLERQRQLRQKDPHYHGNATVTDENEQASKKITTWWKKQLNSGKFLTFNVKGAHPDPFYTLLSGRQGVKKRLSIVEDGELLKDIQAANWHSQKFRIPFYQHSALNLFAADKISWQQKGTISMIMETAQVFGEFEAYSLLNETGDDFSEKGFELIKDFLHYNPMYFLKPSYQEKDGFLSEEERKLFIAKV